MLPREEKSEKKKLLIKEKVKSHSNLQKENIIKFVNQKKKTHNFKIKP